MAQFKEVILMAKQNRKKISARRKAKLASDYIKPDGKRNKTKSKYGIKRDAQRRGKFSRKSPFRPA